MIDKDARAHDPRIAVGTRLGRVRRAATRARRVRPRPPPRLPPAPHPRPGSLRTPRFRSGARSGYERVATAACSDSTIRRRLKDWAAAGVAEAVHALALAAYDRIIGLQLADVPVDGCITKAPCGGDGAGPSPVDRRKGGLKRSTATDGAGVPLGIVSAGANRHDSSLLGPPLAAATTRVGPHWPEDVTVHLDSGYDSGVTRALLTGLGLHGEIARKGVPAPIQAGKRWVCERTHSWMNGFGKLHRCTDRDSKIVDFFLHLAAAFVTVRALIREARTRYRWDTRPTTRRLK